MGMLGILTFLQARSFTCRRGCTIPSTTSLSGWRFWCSSRNRNFYPPRRISLRLRGSEAGILLLDKCLRQGFPKPFLVRSSQLCTPGRQVEDVNGGLAFGVDKSDLDIAFLVGQSGADPVQEAWTVLGNHLNQGAVGRRLVVEFDLRCDLHFGNAVFICTQPVAHQSIQVSLSAQDIADAALEALPLGKIYFQ